MKPILFAVACCLPVAAQAAAPDPKLISIHPFIGQRGTTFTAAVRGRNLSGATAIAAPDAPFSATIEDIKALPDKTPTDLVTLRVTVNESAKPGRYPIRLVTRGGISSALPLQISDLPISLEPPGRHDQPEAAIAVPAFPAVYSGRLAVRGEADFYSFHAEAGQTLTFAVNSGFPQIAAGGSAATIPNFDPSLSIYEAGASWFDPSRLKRIGYNDETVWVYGRVTDAHLVHSFEKAGEYLVRVEAFAGQGGPDYSYSLKIAPGAQPEDLATPSSRNWDERIHTRKLETNRLNQLAVRGGKPETQPAIETYRGAAQPVPFKLPGTIEGTLAAPGETHRARFRIDSPADIAIEIETSAAAPPFFNPIVRLLDAAGEEVATNVFAGRGACSGALTKSLQAKTIVPLRNIGEYTVEVRDAAAELNTPAFRYRLQIRPQVPHVGDVRIDTDAVNLEPGAAKTIRVTFDREEDYRGAIAIAAESLPAGVSASVGADYEPDIDPPSTAGKRERYTPRTERAVVVLSASVDAAPTPVPIQIRLLVRPLADGKLGASLLTKSLPLMVIAKP